MRPNGEDLDPRDLANGLRVTAVALLSAAVTATLVIGVGGAWIGHRQGASSQTAAPASSDFLVRTSG